MENPRFIIKVAVLVILGLGCTPSEDSKSNKNSLLKLSDLQFADFEKDSIAANNIDTTFLIFKSNTRQYKFNDVLGYDVYDSSGRLKVNCKFLYERYIRCYDYDSNSLSIHKYYGAEFSDDNYMTYKFLPDIHILEQFRKGDFEDTAFYKFDAKGRIIKSLEQDERKKKKFTIYEYNQLGQLARRTITFLVSKSWLMEEEIKGAYFPITNITDFFYTGTHLDSTITKYLNKSRPERNYFSRTYYDNRGLKTKTIEFDKLIIVYNHKIRRN